MREKEHLYHVYILTNKHHTVLYTGMTGRELFRIIDHKKKLVTGFTSRYNVTKLVYWEEFDNVYDTIAREKQIKRWSRMKKNALIERYNPEWKDLFVNLMLKPRFRTGE